MADRMEQYARSGYLTAAIDCRYHGDRALPDAAVQGSGSSDPRSAYQDALVRCVTIAISARWHSWKLHNCAGLGLLGGWKQRKRSNTLFRPYRNPCKIHACTAW